MIDDIFAKNVFTDAVMRQRLPKQAYDAVRSVMQHGGRIDLQTADLVAAAMKDWAVEKGATHYSHWFQPLTGSTAENTTAF